MKVNIDVNKAKIILVLFKATNIPCIKNANGNNATILMINNPFKSMCKISINEIIDISIIINDGNKTVIKLFLWLCFNLVLKIDIFIHLGYNRDILMFRRL